MNFEEAQSLWTAQPLPDLATPHLVERQRSLVRELARRGRRLNYELFGLLFGLVALPFFSLVNFVSHARAGTPLYWLSLALHLAVLVGFTSAAVRRRQRHRALRLARCGTLREQAQVALANLDAECREFRTLPWALALWAGLSCLSIYTNAPFHGGTWSAIAPRVGFVVALFGLVGGVFWRHHRVNVLPARDRQSAILRELA